MSLSTEFDSLTDINFNSLQTDRTLTADSTNIPSTPPNTSTTHIKTETPALTSSVTSSLTVCDVKNSSCGSAKDCESCGLKIWDRYVLWCMGRNWHSTCLKCSCCQATLADVGTSCFAKGGMILCKNDYLRSVTT